MLGNVKFMKDLMTKKRIGSFESIENLYYFSAIASLSIVIKKDHIGEFNFAKELYDLGASINLMLLSVFK